MAKTESLSHSSVFAFNCPLLLYAPRPIISPPFGRFFFPLFVFYCKNKRTGCHASHPLAKSHFYFFTLILIFRLQPFLAKT